MSNKIIVVGYDGSSVADKALERARELALRLESSVHLVHAIDWSPFEFQTHEEIEAQSRERREQLMTDRNEVFPPIIEALNSAGIDADYEVTWGHPSEIIADRAAELGAIMIVIGRTGQSKLKSLLFGSVASRTVQMADCPVLVVP